MLVGLANLLDLARDGGPTIFAQVKHGKNVKNIVDLIISAWKASGADEAYRRRQKSNGGK